MIYTITANPSIDYIVTLDALKLGLVNRTTHDRKLPGGKGINVSRILEQLDIPTTAWGFLGGFTGEFIAQQLTSSQLKTDFTPIQADTRINVKLHAESETEINGQGPEISSSEIVDFTAKLAQLKAGDIVVMSGSLPRGLKETFYRDLLPLIHQHHAEFVIDTTGQALLDTLSDHPILVKPNHHELAALFKTSFENQSDMITTARKLLTLGAQHVLISMAGAGALLVTKDQAYHGFAPKGTAINSVGAGDSMVAGFVGTFSKTHDELESFRYGLACGTATAFSEDLATRAKIAEILPQITIEPCH